MVFRAKSSIISTGTRAKSPITTYHYRPCKDILTNETSKRKSVYHSSIHQHLEYISTRTVLTYSFPSISAFQNSVNLLPKVNVKEARTGPNTDNCIHNNGPKAFNKHLIESLGSWFKKSQSWNPDNQEFQETRSDSITPQIYEHRCARNHVSRTAC